MFKFRAYLKKDKRVYTVISIDLVNEKFVYLKPHIINGRFTFTEETASFREAILMESVGMKDRFDVDIYDSDILKIIYRNKEGKISKIISTVIYNNGYFGINEKPLGLMKYKSLEVIGNIYEDPELLRGDK